MRNHPIPILAVFAAFCLMLACESGPRQMHWTHFSIDSRLPGNAWGTGSIALADYDGDGDLDIALSRREVLSAYWYQRRNDSTWVRYMIGTTPYLERALGATELDVDRDGLTDVVINNVWFKNPGNLAASPATPWPASEYSGGGHDVVAADIDGDGMDDLVTYHGEEIYWFDLTNDLERTTVGRGESNHGGVAPRGVGDLDGDGDIDLLIPGYWFANPGSGRGEWSRHTWPHQPIPNATYGTSIRSWVADIDGDGHNDIVYSDCDTRNSHVYWCRNTGGGEGWERAMLPDPPTAPGDVPGTGSWHSLGVADFDRDGDLDIFAGEQEDSTMNGREPRLSMKAKGLKERGVIWLSDGAPEPSFSPYIIHVDNPGWHDARLGDVDGDGDIDIVSKVWNKDGEYYHTDYWRNDSR